MKFTEYLLKLHPSYIVGLLITSLLISALLLYVLLFLSKAFVSGGCNVNSNLNHLFFTQFRFQSRKRFCTAKRCQSLAIIRQTERNEAAKAQGLLKAKNPTSTKIAAKHRQSEAVIGLSPLIEQMVLLVYL